jgi:hypothetical protein
MDDQYASASSPADLFECSDSQTDIFGGVLVAAC